MVGPEGLAGNHLPYFLLYTTASLPMMLRPRAQALSYHVPTKYLFLPNSQAQLLEIPFVPGLILRKLPQKNLSIEML